MAIHKLKRSHLETKRAGMYADGNGLYLQVGEGGRAKSWIFRYSRSRFGKPGEAHMGLGPYPARTVERARELANNYREQLFDGIDPMEARNAEREARRKEAAKQVTFAAAAEEYRAHKARTWALETAKQAEAVMRLYLNPALGKLPVSAIDIDEVHQVLKPIWETKHGTAQLARMHLQQILKRAGRKGTDNPASMEALGDLLHESRLIHTVKHHGSLPHEQIGAFMARLRAYRATNQPGGISVPAKLLEFVILTAVRTKQARLAAWNEFDLEKKLWVCPVERKGGEQGHKTAKRTKQPHVIPLSEPAIAILKAMKTMQQEQGLACGPDDLVFVHSWPDDQKQHRKRIKHGGRLLAGHRLNDDAANVFLRNSMGGPELRNTDGTLGVVVHGFRATFQSWAVEVERADEIVHEMALAHKFGGPMFGKYAGRDAHLLIVSRAQLMDAWGAYCGRTEPIDAKIVPIRSAKS